MSANLVRHSLELVGFRPYGFTSLEDKGKARAEAEASLAKLIPMLNPNPPNGVHVLWIQPHPETSMPATRTGWRYGDALCGTYWKAIVHSVREVASKG